MRKFLQSNFFSGLMTTLGFVLLGGGTVIPCVLAVAYENAAWLLLALISVPIGGGLIHEYGDDIF